MKITESYLRVFNQVPRKDCVVGSPNEWAIVEKKPTAKVKRLSVYFCSDNYLCFDERAVDGMDDLTTKRTSFIDDEKCDGIGFFQKGDKTTMVFVDLKSNFDTGKIQHGFSQGLTSLLKMHSMLSLCEGYDLGNINLEFVVACCCFPNEDKETEICDWMLRESTAKPDSFVSRVAYPLYEKGSISVKIKDFPQMEKAPFCRELMEQDVKLTLIRTAKYTDDYATYTI